MDKFLKLEFQDGKLFKINNKTTDKFGDVYGNHHDRKNLKLFEEPITVYQIANMLSVLFNQRPIPSNRAVLYSRNEYIFEKALNSFLKIDNCKFQTNFGSEVYASELMQTKKAYHMSWKPNEVYVPWEKIKKLLDENYDSFLAFLSTTLNMKNPTDITFSDMRKLILTESDEIKNKIIEFLDNIKGVKSINNYIFNNESSHINMMVGKTAVTVIMGIEKKVVKLSGSILVPMCDEDIEKLQNSKGCATILDGGLVSIKWVRPRSLVSTEGYIPVKNISTKRK